MSKEPKSKKANKRALEAEEDPSAASKREKKRLKKEAKQKNDAEHDLASQPVQSLDVGDGSSQPSVTVKYKKAEQGPKDDKKDKEAKKDKKAKKDEKERKEKVEKEGKGKDKPKDKGAKEDEEVEVAKKLKRAEEEAKEKEAKRARKEAKRAKKEATEKVEEKEETQKAEKAEKKQKKDKNATRETDGKVVALNGTTSDEVAESSGSIPSSSRKRTKGADSQATTAKTASSGKKTKKRRDKLADQHDDISAEEEAMSLSQQGVEQPSDVASSSGASKQEEKRQKKKAKKTKDTVSQPADTSTRDDLKASQESTAKNTKGKGKGKGKGESSEQEPNSGTETKSTKATRGSKPKEPTARERYKNLTWKPPREARVRSKAELDRLHAQRKALAAWAKRHTKRHILIERCFSRMQLGWLTDDIGLEFRRGVFTKEEQATLRRTIEHYKKRNNMSHDVLLDMIYHAKRMGMSRQHQLFFQECAGALEDRANTSVRTHVKTFLHPFWRKGYWTFAELEELKTAFEEVGHDFVTIGQRVGRLTQNARSKWFFLEDARYKANLGPWTVEEKQKLRRAVVNFRRERPRTHILWNEIALEVGGNRHPRTYAAMWHCMRTYRMRHRQIKDRRRELEDEGKNAAEAEEQAKKEWEEHGDWRDFCVDEKEMDETYSKNELDLDWPLDDEWLANGFTGKPAMNADGWEPEVDDLVLVQRLRYQRAARKEHISWDRLSFPQWNWPPELLKVKVDEMLERRCPAYFRTRRSWPAILDKVYWDMERQNFDPGYDPHHQAEVAAEQAAREEAAAARGEDGRLSEADDDDAGEMPSDIDDYMDDDE